MKLLMPLVARVLEYVLLTPEGRPYSKSTIKRYLKTEEGVDIRYVQRLLGHRSIVTTEIYTHVAEAALKSRVIEHPRKSILGRT